jgi:N6-adenosine-specific RNA methylase IME4
VTTTAVEVKRKRSLKDTLDAIDAAAAEEVLEGYYQSRLRILVAMWEKGEAIAAECRGVKSASYYQLEKATGRQRESLKKWHDLYQKYPAKEQYLPGAEQKARQWANRALEKHRRRALAAESRKKGVVVYDDVVTTLEELIEQGKKFATIYADPPWNYGNQGTRAATGNHYGSLTLEEICQEPIPELTEENAHLHLWTTNAFLFEAKQVMEAWGFIYKSVLLWVKPQLGIGNYWRVCHEFLLFGLKGKLAMQDAHKTIPSWHELDRTRHSRKPDEFRKFIEAVSYAPRLEMYGREAHEGWAVYGDEILGTELYGCVS